MDKKDGGYRSRKLWYSIGTSVSIVGLGVMSTFFEAMKPVLDTLVGGLIGVLGLYMTGNVGAKWVISKNTSNEE